MAGQIPISSLSPRLRLEGWTWARAVPVYVIGTLATYWLIERVVAMMSTT